MRTVSLVLAVLATVAKAEDGIVVDQPMRFVNDQVITYGDVREAMRAKAEDLRRRGLLMPQTPAELDAFERGALEEVTDEELLVQEARARKFAVDPDRLSDEIREEARRRGLPLKALAIMRRIRERQATADIMLSWFESRHPAPTPDDIRATYDRDATRWTRPGRVRFAQTSLRTASAEERTTARKEHAALFREAAAAKDPRIAKAAGERLDGFIAGDEAAQDRLIDELAAAIAVVGDAADADRPIVARAAAIARERAVLREPAAAAARLAEVAARIAALPPDGRAAAFAAQAAELGEGPNPAQGGDMGWVEQGALPAGLEDALLRGPVGEVSAPIAVGGAVHLVFVAERSEPRQRPLTEASAEIQAELERSIRESVRTQAVAILRHRAAIRDVTPAGR